MKWAEEGDIPTADIESIANDERTFSRTWRRRGLMSTTVTLDDEYGVKHSFFFFFFFW